MPTETPRPLLEIRYHEAAQEYLRNLPLEHFMEATTQATQRKITVESLGYIEAERDDFHVFNELLVQYPIKGKTKPGQVVPDNMVVLHDGPLEAVTSYDLTTQPAAPYLVLEYVSKSNKRKDYEDNMKKYERELRVPYYLLFYPDTQDLSLYRHNKRKYISVKPNGNGRLAIPELGLEVMLLDGWVRYWYQGELQPLSPLLKRELKETRQERDRAQQERDRAQQERDRAQQERDRAQQERDAARDALRVAEARVDAESVARHAAEQRSAEERQARLAMEQELERVRGEMDELKRRRHHK